jgi:ATP-dependent helicase HrpB
VLSGAGAGQAEQVARLALLVQERGLGGRGEDLLVRLGRWNADRSPRAEASRKLAAGWARKAEKLSGGDGRGAADPALHLARAMPDMVAKRRDAVGEDWLSAGGRGYKLDPASSLARAEWLFIADAQGQAKGARITAAVELAASDIETGLADRIEQSTLLRWNASENRVEARRERRLGQIVLSSGPDPSPDPQSVVDMLVDKCVERLGEFVSADLLARGRFAGIEGLSLEHLKLTAALWLAPMMAGKRALDLDRGRLVEAILGQLDWNDRQRLDSVAPRHFTSPAGTTHAIDYAGDDAPSVEVRVQALFGLDRQPMIGDTPLLLKLTDPGGKPMQATRDLPGFWRGSWRDVQKAGKGRYPKHRWPDEPWAEMPSLKTKNAFSRGDS